MYHEFIPTESFGRENLNRQQYYTVSAPWNTKNAKLLVYVVTQGDSNRATTAKTLSDPTRRRQSLNILLNTTALTPSVLTSSCGKFRYIVLAYKRNLEFVESVVRENLDVKKGT